MQDKFTRQAANALKLAKPPHSPVIIHILAQSIFW